MPAQASACAHRERAATACLQLSHGFPSVEKLLLAKPCWLGKGLLSLAGEEGLWFSSVVRVCEQLPGRDVLSSCWAGACEGGLGVEGLCP